MGGGGSWQGCCGSWALGRKGPLRAGLHPLFPPRPAPDPPRSGEPWSSPRVHCLAQEFENAEGEEYAADFSAQGSPAAAAQNGPDVYVLPLTEVSLPMAKQPGRSGE